MPSSLTTGLNSQSTLHLSAITFLAIPPEIPPICKVVYGGLNIEFLEVKSVGGWAN